MKYLRKINESAEVKTELLDSIGRDLTELATKGKFDPVVGRTDEMDEVIAILARRRKNNPVLVGDPGVGKTAIVEGIAQIIATDEDCPSVLKGKRIIELDMATIMSGTSSQGDLEKKVKRILLELESNPNVILFIDEIHMIVDKNKSVDVSNMFKPALARGDMRCIGATTDKEYKQIERDGALERRFQKVSVDEPSIEDTKIILSRVKSSYESFHKVTYSDDAIDACVKLSAKYFPDRFFPDKAIDLLDEVGARKRAKSTTSDSVQELEKELASVKMKKIALTKQQKYEEATTLRKREVELQDKMEQMMKSEKTVLEITKEDVFKLVSKKIDVPQLDTDMTSKKKYIELESKLKVDIIGQDEAISKVSRCLKRNASGLKDPNRPAGVFLFLGSTGTGKTHSVKSLAKHIFGSEASMIRLDMSEYGEKHNVARLIGSPPGYVGYKEGGQLTEKVRKNPYSIVLLDELEKAHPDVLNVLLQVFEDGRLTDGEGRVVDFKNTVIIMTSNIGSRAAQNLKVPIGFGDKVAVREESAKSLVMVELKKRLAPEFINRIDDIIIFNSLTKESLYSIIDVELRKLTKKIEDLGFNIQYEQEVKDFLIDKGYDPELGARPLRRAITRYIEDPISEEILNDTIQDNIVVGYDKKSGKMTINGNPVNEKLRIKNWKRFNF